MSVPGLAFLIAAASYTGFQWTIRILVYPQFRRVPIKDSSSYEHNHQRLVSYAVGPLFLALGISALAVALDPPSGRARWESVAAPILVATLLAVTALLAVPLHSELSKGFDAEVHRRLLRVDTVRLLVSLAMTVLGTALLR